KRLLVTLAGAWFEVLCWAIATIFWRVTDPSTIPNYLALVVAATLGIKTLFNLNPLIKLDGYYLLSDYLEIPNLRRNAYQYIGRCLRRLAPAGQSRQNSVSRREARIYWLYGLFAAAYSTWLLSWILIGLGRFLTVRYQGWGAVLFLGLVVTIFRNTLRKTGRWLASLFVGSQAIVVRMKRLARLVAIAAVVAAALFFIKTDFKVSGEFRI